MGEKPKQYTLKSVIAGITNALGDMAEDLSECTIVTSTGKIVEKKHKNSDKMYLDVDETAINAKTIIQLDGDIISRIPVRGLNDEEIAIDKEMLALHEKNVEMAMKNWNTVITTLISVVSGLTGLQKSDE